jgi:hypothetical protein
LFNIGNDQAESSLTADRLYQVRYAAFFVNLLAGAVSARALKVANFMSLSGLLHQLGINPHLIGTNVRLSSSRATTSMFVVGQTLKRGLKLRGGAFIVIR